MFKLHAKFNVFLMVIALVALSPIANADVIAPALDIDDLGSGDFISGSATELTINGTGFALITDFGPPTTFIDIADVDFLLTATRGSNNGIDYIFTNGAITAGSYINTTFVTLTMSEFSGIATFAADLASGGRIEGGFFMSGSIASDFGGSVLTAKAGPVVPVPAAVWLFGSGLIGLIGVARRKKS